MKYNCKLWETLNDLWDPFIRLDFNSSSGGQTWETWGWIKKKKWPKKKKERGKHTGKLLPDMRQINCYCLTLRSALGF